MSCIRLTTSAMKEQLRAKVDWDSPVAQFLSPALSDSKLKRLRSLAEDANPKIRESVALIYQTPSDVLFKLSRDPVESVRECVARNRFAPVGVLTDLSEDGSERVRAFVAYNESTPALVVERLGDDPSQLVRGVVVSRVSV